MSADRLREAARVLRERVEAATPGPWFHGDRWHVQGSAHCQCRGLLIHEGRMEINGKMMNAHVHEDPEPWPHGIYSPPTAGSGWHPWNVVNDTDEYGYMDKDDAVYIATMNPLVGLALADWLEAEAAVQGSMGPLTELISAVIEDEGGPAGYLRIGHDDEGNPQMHADTSPAALRVADLICGGNS